MSHLNFIDSSLPLLNAYHGHYDVLLVFISVFVAVAASFTAFLFSEQVKSRTESKFQRKVWLLAGAIALGSGIWGMHFIGMFAYKLPVTVYYDGTITFISIIPAVLAGIIVLNSYKSQSLKALLLRSIVMGSSIGLMHYIGMTAMRLNASMVYSLSLFISSIFVAIFLSLFALYIKKWAAEKSTRNVNQKRLLGASILMGCAISGMHYTGMAAMYFLPLDHQMDFSSALQARELLIYVGLVMLGIFILLLSAIVIRRRIELNIQLKASQHQLQTIFDSTLDGMVIINVDGHIESVNASVKKTFGYSLDEVIGKHFGLFFKDDPDNISNDANNFITDNAYEKNIAIKHELQAQVKSGSEFPIELSISKARFAGAIHFICVLHDISERKQADDFLRETTAKMSAIVDTVLDGIFTINQHGIIQTMNPSIETIFGYSCEELKGKNIKVLMPEHYSREHDGYLHHYLGSENHSVIGGVIEVEGLHKQGNNFPIELSINEFYIGGEHYFTGVVRDISQRKKSERELVDHREHLKELVAFATTEVKAIVQTAINGVITVDEQGIVRLFNPAAQKIFGWQEQEVLGNNIAMLIPEVNIAKHNEYIQRYIDTREARIIGVGREVLALRKDGTTFPAHLAIGHSQLDKRKHLFVGFISDITAQKKSEKELHLAKDNAEQAARSKANFLANMSHEIRTPMNAVIGFSEIVLQDVSLSVANKQYVNTILSSAKNLLGIINDILDFSKIEAGKVNLESVCFHLPNAMRDTLSALAFKAAEKDIALNLSIEENLPVRLLGDPARLRQVVLNIVGNAIKFTPSGSVNITIKSQHDSQLMLFSIEDSGIGMTPSQVQKVFNAFSQADASTNRKFGGTGLGTTISKQIVELMGGEIWAESEIGKGSTFYFTAMFTEAIEIEDCLFEEGHYIQSDYKSPRNFKVLLAEDIPVNATLASLRLEQQGHHITWVENGQLAVDAVKAENYDVVLMDIQMPELDGISAAKLIRQHEIATGVTDLLPIIALTASVMKEDRQLCLDAGMNAIVGKPINFSELLSEMESFVPCGKGDIAKSQGVLLSAQVEIDFSVLNNSVDSQAGLITWKDPLIYAKSLIDFSLERDDDANKMRAFLAQGEDGIEAARGVAHALKGLAGNLSIVNIASVAADIDRQLKMSQLDSVEGKLTLLAELLIEVTAAIALLEIPEEKENQIESSLDVNIIEDVFSHLIQALDELNPDATEPYLEQLKKWIKKEELNVLQRYISDFDFELAKEEAFKLAQQLKMTTGEEEDNEE